MFFRLTSFASRAGAEWRDLLFATNTQPLHANRSPSAPLGMTTLMMAADAALNRPSTYTSFFIFFSSSHFTTFPTSCERSRVVISSASSVSTTTKLFTPTAATNFPVE